MRKSFKIAEKIFLDNDGILRASKAKRSGIDLHTIADMVDAGLLVKEARGIYRLSNLSPLSNPDLVQIALRIPHSVICLISALSFYQLTTQTPYKIYIAILKNTTKPYIEYPPIDVVKLSDEVYSAGIQEHFLDGVLVRIYNKEKTVADCFKFRNKIGLDIAIEALKQYLHEDGRDIEKLLNYARIDRVEKILTPYIEAII